MFDGGLKKLLEPTTAPLPAWLAGNSGQYGATGYAMLAATSRVNFEALLKGARTYCGKPGKVSLGEQVMLTDKSHMSITATTKGLRFRVDGLGFYKEGLYEVADWELTVGIRDGDLIFIITEPRSSDKDLANEDLFFALRSAVTEALQQPPRISDPMSVADALALLKSELIDDALPIQHTSRLPRTATVSAAAADVIEDIAAKVVNAQLRKHLDATDKWQLASRAGSEAELNARTGLELWTLGTILILGAGITDGAVAESLKSAVGQLAGDGSPEPTTTPAEPVEMLSATSRFLPFSVSGHATMSATTSVPMSTWPCVGRVNHVRVGKWKFATDLHVPVRLGLGGLTGYEYGPSLKTNELGPLLQRKATQSHWGLKGFNDSEHETLQGTRVLVSGLSFRADRSTMPSSDALLAWLAHTDAMFEPPTGDGGASVTVVDRSG